MTRRVTLGTVGRPHGLAGDVHVRIDPDLSDTLVAGLGCHVGGRTLRVAAVRSHRGRRLVRFADVDDREAAAELRGLDLEVDRGDVVLGDGAVWADQLLGRDVVDAHGAPLGVVDRLLDGAAHDFLVVLRPGGGELLVPVVDEIVDLGDPVTVHGPPGLTDPDEAIE